MKIAFSHGASLKNCCRTLDFCANFFLSKIFKIDLSPTREIKSGCLENCLGRLLLVPKICKLSVLPGLVFEVPARKKQNACFCSGFVEILVFLLFFHCFGNASRAPLSFSRWWLAFGVIILLLTPCQLRYHQLLSCNFNSQ